MNKRKAILTSSSDSADRGRSIIRVTFKEDKDIGNIILFGTFLSG
jgi:hypothetical protein